MNMAKFYGEYYLEISLLEFIRHLLFLDFLLECHNATIFATTWIHPWAEFGCDVGKGRFSSIHNHHLLWLPEMESPHMIRSLLARFQREYILILRRKVKKNFIKCQKVKIISYCAWNFQINCNHRSYNTRHKGIARWM